MPAPAGSRYVICLALAIVFTASATPAAEENLAFRVNAAMPYLAFDKLAKTTVDVPGGRLAVAFAPGEFHLGKQKLLAWVERSARAIAVYFEGFPVKSARILLVPDDGTEAQGGQAFCNAGAAVRLLVGQYITQAAIDDDWQLPHEMVHLSFPTIPKATWLSEGLAVYVESIARAQAGDLTGEHIWGEFARMMPSGLPKKGDKGLDAAESQERVYWGGATFWLMADLEIRKRTGNRAGLQDALLGILAAGGTCEQVWSINRTLAAGDAATGQTVLSEMHAKWRATRMSPDLGALWRDLGIKISGQAVVLEDAAPLASIRRAITTRRVRKSGARPPG